MFDAPPEVRMAAGYFLVLCCGVVMYMRFGFARAANDMSARSSIVRVIVVIGWGATIALNVMWPDVLRHWNFFMFDGVRWFTTVPAVLAILLMVWSLRSQLLLDEQGNIVATGPYAWCRYPFDAGLAVFFVSITLLCSNWLVLSITLVVNLLHRIGVTFELERARRIRLGAAYDAYAARSGCFLPSAEPVGTTSQRDTAGQNNNAGDKGQQATTPAKKTQYQVPSRFGLTAIMGLLTILAIIFGWLKSVDAPPEVYLFIGSEIMAICLAQILVGSAPRSGSILTGAVLLPFWVYMSVNTRSISPLADFLMIVVLAVFGALLGYLIGALAAGFFLVMDLIEPWLVRNTTAANSFNGETKT
jgi:protein-S-isoprenylcysteine O-methyltransferase Ste14